MLGSLKDRLKQNQAEATTPRSTVSASTSTSAGGGFRHRLPFKDACKLPLDKIDPDPDQPRKTFADDSIERTARSLLSVGQIVPIIVRHDQAADRFILIDGERRYRAAQVAGLAELSAVVDNKANAETVLEIQLVVNALREDVNPMEQARAWERLARLNGKSLRELAEMLNYDHTVIGRKISLLSLPDEIQADIEGKRISQETGIALARIEDPAEQAALAERAKAGELPRSELRERIARPRTAAAPGKPKGRGGKVKLPARVVFRGEGGVRIAAERARGVDMLTAVAALERALDEARERLGAAAQRETLQETRDHLGAAAERAIQEAHERLGIEGEPSAA